MVKKPTRTTRTKANAKALKAKKPRRPKSRQPDPAATIAKLDEIEAEMKRIGFWSPDSEIPEHGDFLSMPLEQWFQFVFLPAARAVTQKRKWPSRSQVGLLALRNYEYHGTVEEALSPVQLMNEFDDLIEHP